jgi:hypothetical protein
MSPSRQRVESLFLFTRRAAASFLVAVATLAIACSGKHEEKQVSNADAPECVAYVAAYQGCFDKLGPEARAIGDRILAPASARLVASARGARAVQGAEGGTTESERDANQVRERCKQATQQLIASCR